jgi:PelA/Pel-15E family pectate lyase
MRYLARVWKAASDQQSAVSYQQAFLRGLNMILSAQKGCGGWSQYWPLSNDNGYQDYITFNDDLIVNVLKLLRDIYNNQGDFADITDAGTRTWCQGAFERGVQCIMDCQVNIDGTYAAWCAQHDTVAPYLPTEGRPQELPSVSGYESANLLTFLMSIEDPSDELKQRITAAVNWLEAHKIPNHAVEDYTNTAGQKDRHIIEKTGTHLWGRFIQIGGNTGTEVYNKFFNKLKARGKKRSYTYNGVTYTYTEEELARANYDPAKADEPVYAIYKDTFPHMYYRAIYNYEDTPIAFDDRGCPYYTSLFTAIRMGYQYIGSWPQRVIEVEYPAWKAKYSGHDEGTYVLSPETCVSKQGDKTFTFNNAFTITNDGAKGYVIAKKIYMKLDADVTYTIHIPEDLQVNEATIRGYANYEDADASITMWNNANYPDDVYFFPRTEAGGKNIIVAHTIDHSARPVTGELPFKIKGKQLCMSITLTCSRRTSGVESSQQSAASVQKIIRNGQILILRDGIEYTILGSQF